MILLVAGGCGCGLTNGLEDAGPDARGTFDAGESSDAGSDGADGWQSSDAPGPDAWAADAWARELCNGLDDDGDALTDEGSTDCQEASGGEEAVCWVGRCLCRPPDALAGTGDRGDCNDDWSDGCETSLDSDTDCGGCGIRCDVVSSCAGTTAGGLACGAAEILDLSVSRPLGDITCVVRADDNLVVCRGPNTEHAISDTADETAELDWTLTDLPRSTSVRTWLRRRADGRDVLSICAIALGGQVVCRGDNGNGALGYGDSDARSGNHVLPIPGVVVELFTWGGSAYALVLVRLHLGVIPVHELYRWTATSGPELWLENVWHLSLGDMPIAELVSPTGALYTWGSHTGLALIPSSTPPWEAPTEFLRADSAWGGDALGPAICSVDPWANSLNCVQATPDARLTHGGRRPPSAATLIADGDLSASGMAPASDGGTLVCAHARSAGGTRVFCDLLSDIIGDRGPGIRSLTEHPEMVSADGRGPRTRMDWQAHCVVERPDLWRCFGAHGGWGHPSAP